MLIDKIDPKDSGCFSKLMVAYLNNDKTVQSLFNRFPTLDNFKAQIEEKQANYSQQDRYILVDALTEQYKNIETSELTLSNIKKLALSNTFTITTGHQLNLFTGPVYYIYKILSVINLTEQLTERYPENNFVPVFWMASEDHDFEEINYFKFRDKKIKWPSNQKGPVGLFSTKNINLLTNTIKKEFGNSQKAQFLINLFTKSYTEYNNLSSATFFLANELFRKFGIIIIDGNNKILKNNFKSVIKTELTQNTLYNNVSSTLPLLHSFHTQVNPREINLFYIEKGIRERIVKERETYRVLNTDIHFNESEILNLATNHPEKFSPNAIFRPIYQEAVLPNLAYVGGGGELAYWLELKTSFEALKITYPILVHRDSVLLVTKKQNEKIKKLNVSYKELFLNNETLHKVLVKKYSENFLDFSDLKRQLQKQFDILRKTAIKTDSSFENALNAQEKKQFKGLENLEKKLLKAESKILKDKINRVFIEKEALFPNNSLQERTQNFSEFYIDNEEDFIAKIKTHLNPLEVDFKVIET